MEPIQIASIIVAAISALGAWASQRSASKALTKNANSASRVEMEKEAYDRARKFDTDTIERQDAEIAELRGEVSQVREENKQLRKDNDSLRSQTERLSRENDELHYRLAVLEEQLLPHSRREDQ